jgi:hypothetical protein
MGDDVYVLTVGEGNGIPTLVVANASSGEAVTTAGALASGLGLANFGAGLLFATLTSRLGLEALASGLGLAIWVFEATVAFATAL